MELHLASAAACADGSAVHRDAQPLVALRAADLIAGGASEPLTIPLPHTRAFGPLRARLLRLRLGCRFRLRHRFRLGFRLGLGLRFRCRLRFRFGFRGWFRFGFRFYGECVGAGWTTGRAVVSGRHAQMLTAGGTFDLPFLRRRRAWLPLAHPGARLLARLPASIPACGTLLRVLLAPENDVAGGDGQHQPCDRADEQSGPWDVERLGERRAR